MRKFKKLLSVALSAVMLGATLFTGNTANAATSEPLIKDMTVAGDAGYIQSFYKSDYMNSGKNGFQLKFEYTKLGTVAAQDDTVKDDTEEKDLGYNNSLQFVVFDTSWGGWEPTMIGPNGYDKEGEVTPKLDTEYTVDVPFSVIESKLTTGLPVQGINLQTGGVSDCQIKINSLTYADVEEDVKPVESSSPVLIEGDWHKTSDEAVDFGTMKVVEGSAYVSANAWNIGISNLNVATFGDPMIAVTVEYGEIADPPIYPQAEVLDAAGKPFVENYPQVSEAGEVTYLTSIPKSTWTVTLAYDTCTVKKVQIFDYDESYATEVYDLTNADIIKAMGAGWNLGNALDAVTEDGVVSETAWGNPEVTKYLFKVVSEAGFKTVRIPVSWVDAVKVTGDTYQIDENRFTEILDRVQTVVDWARDYDLFVIINIQHDGGEGVKGAWLDIDAANQTGIQAAFADIWSRIAIRFRGYDQHLIFESMNEVMESGNYGTPNQTTWGNINYLNQSFVDTVRDTGAHNDVRFLLVPGYNTNIDQTVTDNFVMPKYKRKSDHMMVSVHFYDPYNFTLNTGGGSTTEISRPELNAIKTQFDKLKKFTDAGIPVVIGEIGAMDKGNIPAIQEYITTVVQDAQEDGLGYIYWDNGYTGENGMGLWNRYTYGESALGKALIPILVSTGTGE